VILSRDWSKRCLINLTQHASLKRSKFGDASSKAYGSISANQQHFQIDQEAEATIDAQIKAEIEAFLAGEKH
jgi:hypothetical protein